jgi:hypothetical protein
MTHSSFYLYLLSSMEHYLQGIYLSSYEVMLRGKAI